MLFLSLVPTAPTSNLEIMLRSVNKDQTTNGNLKTIQTLQKREKQGTQIFIKELKFWPKGKLERRLNQTIFLL